MASKRRNAPSKRPSGPSKRPGGPSKRPGGPSKRPGGPSKRPGRNIPDVQRHTVKVQLRVGPTVADSIGARSKMLGIDKSRYISQLVIADVARSQIGIELSVTRGDP